MREGLGCACDGVTVVAVTFRPVDKRRAQKIQLKKRDDISDVEESNKRRPGHTHLPRTPLTLSSENRKGSSLVPSSSTTTVLVPGTLQKKRKKRGKVSTNQTPTMASSLDPIVEREWGCGDVPLCCCSQILRLKVCGRARERSLKLFPWLGVWGRHLGPRSSVDVYLEREWVMLGPAAVSSRY